MTQGEIFQKTIQHIGEYLEQDVSHVTLDSRLDAIVPGLDSLKIFEMTLYLEDCFDVEFDESKLGGIETMRDLVNYIELSLTSKSLNP